jgi:hypothetical protein
VGGVDRGQQAPQHCVRRVGIPGLRTISEHGFVSGSEVRQQARLADAGLAQNGKGRGLPPSGGQGLPGERTADKHRRAKHAGRHRPLGGYCHRLGHLYCLQQLHGLAARLNAEFLAQHLAQPPVGLLRFTTVGAAMVQPHESAGRVLSMGKQFDDALSQRQRFAKPPLLLEGLGAVGKDLGAGFAHALARAAEPGIRLGVVADLGSGQQRPGLKQELVVEFTEAGHVNSHLRRQGERVVAAEHQGLRGLVEAARSLPQARRRSFPACQGPQHGRQGSPRLRPVKRKHRHEKRVLVDQTDRCLPRPPPGRDAEEPDLEGRFGPLRPAGKKVRPAS